MTSEPTPGSTPLAQPPPPRPPRINFRDRPVGVAGVVLACSTPITGLLLYALASIVFGESHFEGPDGLTAAGGAMFVAPALLGAILVVWSFLSPSSPPPRTMAALAAVASAAFLGAGLWSTMTASGDASIGGGLLLLASIPLVAAALWLFGSRPGR